MALWPFGRKRRKPRPQGEEKDEKDDENLGITTQITGPKGSRTFRRGRDAKKQTKQPSRNGSTEREIDTNDLPTPPAPPAPSAPPSIPLPPIPPKAPERTKSQEAAAKAAAQQIKRPGNAQVEVNMADTNRSNMVVTAPRPASQPSSPVSPVSTRRPWVEAAIQEEGSQTSEPLPPPMQPLQPKPHAQYEASQSSAQVQNFYIDPEAPSLRSPRGGSRTDLPGRQKSQKRKAADKKRAQEIKSMSEPIPIMAKRNSSFASAILSGGSRVIPQGFRPSLSRPASEASLPIAASIGSQETGVGDTSTSYKVRTFDAFSPRPAIRYAESSRMGGSTYAGSRAASRKERGPPILEEEFPPRGRKARVEDVAFDLDSNDLRKILERDTKRREKRRQRREAKQKAVFMNDPYVSGDAGPSSLTQTTRRADNNNASTTVEDITPPSETAKSIEAGFDSQVAQKQIETWQQGGRQNSAPTDDPYEEPNSASQQDSSSSYERESPVVETAREVRLSAASMTPPASPVLQHHQPRGPSGLSKVTSAAPEPAREEAQLDASRATPEPTASEQASIQASLEETPRRDSESTHRVRAGEKLKSFFRRGAASSRQESIDKGRSTPSEFSNTSRESSVRQAQNYQPPVRPHRSFRRSDGVPQRTRSKFKEDLPELPRSPRIEEPPVPEPFVAYSPPRSPRLPRSPGSPASPYIDHALKVETMDEQARATTPLGEIHPAFREEVTLSRGQSVRSDPGEGPSANLLSQSLASVDSEGSWLSGKPPAQQKRSSIPINSVRESVTSLADALPEKPEPTDDYFARRETSAGKRPARSGLTSQLERERSNTATSATSAVGNGAGGAGSRCDVSPLEETPNETEEAKMVNVHEGKATLVQRGPAVKSREILLDEIPSHQSSGGISPISGSDWSDPSQGKPSPQEELKSPPQPQPQPQREKEPEPAEETAEENVSLHRATSVNYGRKHERAVSVGSARMLDIPRRASGEQKRSSTASGSPPHGSPLIHQTTHDGSDSSEDDRAESRPEAAAAAVAAAASTVAQKEGLPSASTAGAPGGSEARPTEMRPLVLTDEKAGAKAAAQAEVDDVAKKHIEADQSTVDTREGDTTDGDEGSYREDRESRDYAQVSINF